MGEGKEAKQSKQEAIDQAIRSLESRVKEVASLASRLSGNPLSEPAVIDNRTEPDTLSLSEFLNSAPSRIDSMNNTVNEALEQIKNALF